MVYGDYVVENRIRKVNILIPTDTVQFINSEGDGFVILQQDESSDKYKIASIGYDHGGEEFTFDMDELVEVINDWFMGNV